MNPSTIAALKSENHSIVLKDQSKNRWLFWNDIDKKWWVNQEVSFSKVKTLIQTPNIEEAVTELLKP